MMKNTTMTLYFIVVFIILSFVECKRVTKHGYIPRPRNTIQEMRHEEIPHAFDWRFHDNTRWLTSVRNQFLPRWCGSCWAQATTSSLSDRYKIYMMRHAPEKYKTDIDFSPQALLDCGEVFKPKSGSCEGGDDAIAYEWIHRHGITDTSCTPYLASDNNCLEGTSFCKTCYDNGICRPINGTKYFVSHHDRFYGKTIAENVTAIMKEVYLNGPVTCSIYSEYESFHCYKGGVLHDFPGDLEPTHVVSIVGWGVDNDHNPPLPYWIARHSGGTLWGDEGFFYISRGFNTLQVEKYCHYGDVEIPPSVGVDSLCTGGEHPSSMDYASIY